MGLDEGVKIQSIGPFKTGLLKMSCMLAGVVFFVMVEANRAFAKIVFTDFAITEIGVKINHNTGAGFVELDSVPPISYRIANIQLSDSLSLEGLVDTLNVELPEVTFKVPIEKLFNVPFYELNMVTHDCLVQQIFEDLPPAFQTAYYHEQQSLLYFTQNTSECAEAITALLQKLGATDIKVDEAFVNTIIKTTSLRVWLIQILTNAEAWSTVEATHPYHPKQRLLTDIEEYQRILVKMENKITPEKDEMVFYNAFYNFLEYDVEMLVFNDPKRVGKCSSSRKIQELIDALKEPSVSTVFTSYQSNFHFTPALTESIYWNTLLMQHLIDIQRVKRTSQ